MAEVFYNKEFQDILNSVWAGRNAEFHERISYSTNQRIRELAESAAPHGTLVAADVQEGGKGRRGREWMTPPAGTNIAMSLLLRPEDVPPSKASMLTLVAALAVRDGVERITGRRSLIKWPNDLVLNRKKICGILTEMSMEGDHIGYIVIGIGINVNNEVFDGELKEKATSLYLETGKKWNRTEIMAACMEAFERYYDIFVRDLSLKNMLNDYNASLAGIGHRVMVLEPGGDWEGISRGINAEGELLVEKTDGMIETVYSGEVSVRGLYGYV